MKGNCSLRVFIGVMVLNVALPSFAQDGRSAQTSPATGQSAGSIGESPVSRVPRWVRFNGTLRDLAGKMEAGAVALTLALYEEQEGGSPLWTETQRVQLDNAGRYSVLLGATQPAGLPLDLFTSGRARWLGVRPELPGAEEQPRILLVGVPYALKAADADTLGGKPASAFVLSGTLPGSLEQSARSAVPRWQNPQVSSSAVGGSGLSNFIPKWSDGVNLSNSVIYQAGNNVGIGTKIPAGALDVIGNAIVRGTLYPQCVEYICFADRFPGSDIGARINAAYAHLPPSGGIIRVLTSGSFSTPIVFSSPLKPVILEGSPGGFYGHGGVILTFTATSGSAITLNWGGVAPGAGVRNLALHGSGGSSVGIMVGGSLGVVESSVSYVYLEGFNVNLEMGPNSYLNHFDNCHLRAPVTSNLLIPAGEVIENAAFEHCVFADSPVPYTNGVVVNAWGTFEFTDCSFDQSQIVIRSNAIVKIKGGHLENPNQGVPYDFIDFSGNTLDLIGTDILNILLPPQPGPAETINISGGTGTVVLSATQFYGAVPQKSFFRIAPGANPSIFVYGHTDTSLAYTGPFIAGKSSGTIMMCPDPGFKNLFYSGQGTASSASAGSQGPPPLRVAGYLIVNIGGTNFKIPYYNN